MTVNARYWRSLVRHAEAELDAAARLSEVKVAAQRLMRARAALAGLEAAVNGGNRQPERLT